MKSLMLIVAIIFSVLGTGYVLYLKDIKEKKIGRTKIIESIKSYAGCATYRHYAELRNDSLIYIAIFENCTNAERKDSLRLRITEMARKMHAHEFNDNDQPWLWREAKLKDPDGNQLILFYAGHNRKNPPWRLEK